MHSGRYSAEGNITTNIAHFGAGRFGKVEFSLPPMEERTEIIHRVETLFALADCLEARYATARAQVDKFTPALLATVFRDELVPQNSDDESASELLMRIYALRNGHAAGQSKRERGRKTVTS